MKRIADIRSVLFSVTCYLLPELAMTIRLTRAEALELHEEGEKEEIQFDPTDELDTVMKYDTSFNQEWCREIKLRDDIFLEIEQVQNRDRVICTSPYAEDSDNIYCAFLLSGSTYASLTSTLGETSWHYASGKYWLNGTGSRNQLITDCDTTPWCRIAIVVKKKTFYSFTSPPERELPQHFQRLVKSVDQEVYRRIGDIQPMMMTALQQILHCSYQSMVKRAYLESKVIELLALVLDHETVIQQGESKKKILKPEQLERVHYAKEILLKDLENSPSIAELAHIVGLSESLLKRGFRQAFGTTVFDMLQSYRLDIARQLLANQNINIIEVAQHSGYGSATTFGRAFKKKFGVNPKQYQKACR
ncbi:MAG: AraC family transcriptional regulator [Cyanobacteria bacterium P01_A01_bin.17]